MTLEEIRNSRKIHDVIWTYNLCASDLNKKAWDDAEAILKKLIDTLSSQSKSITEQQVKTLFAQTTLELEIIFGASPLDEMGVYEYGGLNDFFADIMEAMNFPVKRGKHYLLSNFVYGTDFEET